MELTSKNLFLKPKKLPRKFDKIKYYETLVTQEPDALSLFSTIPSEETYHFIAENLVIRSVTIHQEDGEPLTLFVQEESRKPRDVKKSLRNVYQYILLAPLNVRSDTITTTEFTFRVEKQWLTKKKFTPEEIGVGHYINGQWLYQTAEIIAENEQYYTYASHINGLGIITIFVGEYRDWQHFTNLNTVPYFVVGTVYETNGRTHAPAGTQITIQNEETEQTLTLHTGIGPLSGSYAVIVPGEKNDEISIMIMNDSSSTYTFRLKQQANQIDFKKKLIGQNYRAKKGNTSRLKLSTLLETIRNLLGF